MNRNQVFLFFLLMISLQSTKSTLPKGFSYLKEEDGFIINLKYLTYDNFIGHVIPGYKKNVGILTTQAANALKNAANDFIKSGYKIVVYDAYRPQTAVSHFVDWIFNSSEQKRKKFHYPRENKEDFIEKGYVADRSGHSRGSTIDLSIIPINGNLNTNPEWKERTFKGITFPYMDDGTVDTGTSFDLMDEISAPDSTLIEECKECIQNRLFIKRIMEKNNFKALDTEWWHFTLNDEPYPNTFFSFPVE